MKRLLTMLALAWTIGAHAADSHMHRALQAIFEMDRKGFETHLALTDNKAERTYLQEYRRLMLYTANNSEANYDLYLAASDRAIDALGSAPADRQPTMRCNLLLHKCMVELSKNNTWTGGMLFWKSYKAFKEGEKVASGQPGQLKLRGIYNVLLAQIPDKWKTLAGFIGFGQGNLEHGLAQIEDYCLKVRDIEGLNQESQLLAFVNFFLSNSRNMNPRLEKRMQQSPSPVVVYTYILTIGKDNRGATADSLLATLPAHAFEQFPLLMHQKGKIALRRLDTRSAIACLDRFLATYTGITGRANALTLTAWALELPGRDAEGQAAAQKAADVERFSASDANSAADARRYAQTDTTLLKARLLTEYGLYDKALAALDGYRPDSATAIEYHFRRGRICQLKGLDAQAIEHYDKAIAQATADKRFHGPYAALYAAQIKVETADMTAASAYLDKAARLNNGEYQKDIEQRISLLRKKAGVR